MARHAREVVGRLEPQGRYPMSWLWAAHTQWSWPRWWAGGGPHLVCVVVPPDPVVGGVEIAGEQSVGTLLCPLVPHLQQLLALLDADTLGTVPAGRILRQQGQMVGLGAGQLFGWYAGKQ